MEKEKVDPARDAGLPSLRRLPRPQAQPPSGRTQARGCAAPRLPPPHGRRASRAQEASLSFVGDLTRTKPGLWLGGVSSKTRTQSDQVTKSSHVGRQIQKERFISDRRLARAVCTPRGWVPSAGEARLRRGAMGTPRWLPWNVKLQFKHFPVLQRGVWEEI